MKNEQSLEERVLRLEFLLTHQQKLTEDLNAVLVDQSKRIIKLERSLVQLETQMKDSQMVSREIRDPLEEKPPHY